MRKKVDAWSRRRTDGAEGVPAVDSRSGHRIVVHDTDVCVQAWAHSRELCIAETVQGSVSSFVDTSPARVNSVRRCRFDGGADQDLIVAVLDEVLYRVDSHQEVPVHVQVTSHPHSVEMLLAMADLGTLPREGAVPKAVSLQRLQFGSDRHQWSCSVTLNI